MKWPNKRFVATRVIAATESNVSCRAVHAQRWAPEIFMRISILFIAALLFAAIWSAQAAELPPAIKTNLHAASQYLEQHTDRDSVVQSLYEQIRPRANITEKSLAASEVDKFVRSYISDKYAPALIANYALLYSKLTVAKAEFSTDKDLRPFKLSDNLIAVLCIAVRGDNLQVEYRTNTAPHGTGWTTSAVFVFVSKVDSLTLSGIELPFKSDTKVYVDGI